MVRTIAAIGLGIIMTGIWAGLYFIFPETTTLEGSSCPDGCEIELKVGLLLDQTGDRREIGRFATDGARLAADEVNRAGVRLPNGVRLTVRLISEDPQGSPGYANQRAEKLAGVDLVPVIVGPVWHSGALATVPVASARKVVLLPLLDPDGQDDWVFPLIPRMGGGATGMLDLVRTLHKSRLVGDKVAILGVNNAYGRGIAETLRSECVYGLDDIYHGYYEEGMEDYTPVLESIMAAKSRFAPDETITVVLAESSSAQKILHRANELGMTPENGFMWVVFQSQFAPPMVSAGIPGTYLLSPAMKLDPPLGDLWTALGYDGVRLAAAAALRSGSVDGSGIREGIESYSLEEPYPGATGPKAWDEEGILPPRYGISQYVNDRYCPTGGYWDGALREFRPDAPPCSVIGRDMPPA